MEPSRTFRRTKKQITTSNRNFSIMQVSGMITTLNSICDQRMNSEKTELREEVKNCVKVIRKLQRRLAITTLDDWK